MKEATKGKRWKSRRMLFRRRRARARNVRAYLLQTGKIDPQRVTESARGAGSKGSRVYLWLQRSGNRHSPPGILRRIPYPVETFGFKPAPRGLPSPLLKRQRDIVWQQAGLFEEVNER